jgi:hypothetical protein
MKGMIVNRILYYISIMANILALLVVVFLMITEARGAEVMILMLVMLPPATALFSIISLPGPEERALARKVRMARLKKELEDLGG